MATIEINTPDIASTSHGLQNGYRNVFVHLDGSAEDEVRIAHAELLATRFDAHLTGLYTNPLPDPGLYAGEFGAHVVVDLSESVRKEGDAAEARLKRRFDRLAVRNEVRRLENYPVFLARDFVSECRCSDLVVVSCPSASSGAQDWRALIETILFECGHGLYLVPHAARLRRDLRCVLIGWVDTREAARAVSEAMPLLRLAKQVHLVSVREPEKGRFGGAEVLAEVAQHLDRHGVKTTVGLLPDGGQTGAALLMEAHRISADMIVAGGYGHARLREWLLGGTTRDLLETSDLPILMAH